MQSPLNNDSSDLPILTDRAVLYGSTDQQMSSQASPQAPEKNADLDVTTPTTADERVAFIEGTTRETSASFAVSKTARLVYFIFMLHGVGCLMPWNMFLTIAPKYFIDYKLMPLDKNETIPDYNKYFFSYLGVCSQIPNLLLNFLNLFIVLKADLSRRIIVSLVIVAAICVFTIVFIFVDTFSWMTAFFTLTMISVVVLSSANGVYQNSIYGLAAIFPHNFTNAVVIGNNVCGIFVTVVLILTLLFLQNVKIVALLYFSVALATIMACLFSFLYLPKLSFYSYHTNQAQKRSGENADEPQRFTFAHFNSILSQTSKQMMSVFLTFFVTLALFPAIVSNIPLYPSTRPYDFFLPQDLYIPVTTFLNFNIFATVGNVLANYVQWPKNKDSLIYPVALRLLFIPFFLFCNYGGPNRSYPVYFASEYAFAFMLALMSFTHGYFSSISMIYAPAKANDADKPKAGMMSAFFLVLGITLGVVFTFFESYLFLKSSS